MTTTSIMAFFSALALGHSLFLASHFWTSVRKKPSSFFLALLLTGLAIRILKSVIVILFPTSPDIIPAVGLIGLSTIGPSLYLYIQSFKNRSFQIKKGHLWHFTLGVLLILLLPFLSDQQMYWAYCLTVAHMFVYLLLVTKVMWKGQKNYTSQERSWIWLLISGIGLIWLTFFAQLIIEVFLTYLSVTIVASVVIYGLSYWAGKKQRLFQEPNRSSPAKRSNERAQIGEQIQYLFKKKKLFKEPNLSIRTISQYLSQPEYLVSQSINAYFNKSFPELLNEYRVEYAARLIQSKAYQNLSIEGIAYESGYKSISAFYKAFKNIKGVTPAQFKHQ